MAAQAVKKSDYTAVDIEVLEGLEPVRRRPGMYIGGTEGYAGLHHLVKEILDNAIDEAMNGHANEIFVTLHKDGESITVEDNGRGIPIDVHPKYKKPALELLLTTLHSGGKFSDNNYQSAGGLHGVGASVVNALSSELIARVWREGYEWTQKFERGKPVTKLQKVEKSKKRGTAIFFRPDNEMFKSTRFHPGKLERTIEEKAFLNKGVKIHYINEGSGEKKEFLYQDGVKAYLNKLLEEEGQKSITSEIFYLEKPDGIKAEVAFAWTEATAEKILSYANGIPTSQGGTHEEGFKLGMSKALRNYMSVHELVPKGMKVVGEDFREGMFAVVSVNIPVSIAQLQFQGQTKDKLNTAEVEPVVDQLVRGFENYLNSNPKLAATIVERILISSKARAASRAASQNVSRKIGISHRLTLPGKLADCSSNDPDDSEVFIVEGDSAGGSAKQGRDRKLQAVLPLRGKILNSFAAASGKVGENKELLDLAAALGCGHGPDLRIEKLRYGKVIILTDADADGMHIATLLMAFFFRFMRPLIKAGNIYLGMSPLYKIKIGSGAKEQTLWAYNDEEKQKILGKEGKNHKVHVTRFKGLGEMNPSTLWETSLNPKTRNLLKITADNEAQVEEVFNGLLGKDTSIRYRLIQENAHKLDVDL